MTCLVALQGPAGTLIGTDSGVTMGHILSRMGPKIIQRGPLTLAYAGSIRAAQILEHLVEVPQAPRRGKPERFLVRGLVEPLRASLRAHGASSEESQINLLIAYRKQLWFLGDDFSIVAATNGYAVAGEAEDIVRGVLEATEGQPQELRVQKALEISAKLCPSVASPFHYLLV